MENNEKSIRRALLDDAMLDAAYRDLASVVTGNARLRAERSQRKQTADAVSEILAFYHRKAEIPEDADPVTYVTEAMNISARSVSLEDDWYKEAIGPYLGRTTDGQTVNTTTRARAGVYVSTVRRQRSWKWKRSIFTCLCRPESSLCAICTATCFNP